MSTITVQNKLEPEEIEWPLQHEKDGIVHVLNTADKWEVGLDAADFTPEDIEVKVLNDRLFIDCRHEERMFKHGTIAREVRRTYHLPKDVDITTMKSHFDKKGTLIIEAHKKH